STTATGINRRKVGRWSIGLTWLPRPPLWCGNTMPSRVCSAPSWASPSDWKTATRCSPMAPSRWCARSTPPDKCGGSFAALQPTGSIGRFEFHRCTSSAEPSRVDRVFFYFVVNDPLSAVEQARYFGPVAPRGLQRIEDQILLVLLHRLA